MNPLIKSYILFFDKMFLKNAALKLLILNSQSTKAIMIKKTVITFEGGSWYPYRL